MINTSFCKTLCSGTLIGVASLSLLAPSTKAQIVPAANTTGTTVDVINNQFNIGGGTLSGDGKNLFHLFREFGVGSGQTANFLSNPHIRNILAGVNGGNASYINGLLQVSGGNSNLYLLNPAGIVFGLDARLNLPAAFHASTASRVHFAGGIFDLNGSNTYTNLVGNPTGFEFANKGILINEGTLSVNPGQTLSLMAHQVINTGTLTAPGGTVNIVAVPETGLVRVSQEGMLLSLEIPQERLPADRVIQAVELPTLLAGGNGYPAVNSVIQNADGTISLVHDATKLPMTSNTAIVGGTLNVASPSGQGGQITIAGLGSNIGLINAQLNASGATGGGTILVGGDYLGGTTGTHRLDSSFNAQNLFVNASSTLNANALNNGNGGTIINWAESSTRFYGQITARGGTLSGDGGFVEVSGKQYLDFQGLVDTTATNGATGTLLLDPTDIFISDSSDSAISSSSPFQANPDTATLSYLNITTLLNALSSSNVIVTTASSAVGPSGNITVQSPIISGSTNSLTLQADNNIIIQGQISIQGALDLQAQGAIQNNFFLSNPINISAASIQANAPIQTNGTTITLNATGNIILPANGNITTLGSMTMGVGNITITSANGTISLGGTVTAGLGNITLSGNTNLLGATSFSGSAIGVNGNINLAGSTSFDGSGININGNISGNHPLSFNSSGMTILGGTINVGSITTGTTGTTQIRGNLDTTGNQVFNNPVTINDATPSTPLTINGNELIFNSTFNTGSGVVSLTSNQINFNGGAGSVAGSGTFILGKNTGTFSQTDLTPLANGFGAIILSGPSNVSVISNLTVQDPLIIASFGSITTNGNSITGTDNASITILSTTPQTFQTFQSGGLNLANLSQLPIGQGSLNVGSISTAGGNIALIGQGITTGNLLTSALGTGIFLNATGNISTANLTTNAGPVSLSASNGSVTTGNIFTRGGNISIAASNGNITGGSLISAGSGGNVNLSGMNILLSFINAGTGNVSIAAGNSLRLTGAFSFNGIPTSIYGNAIDIFINSDPFFLVGDPSLNGTLGALVTPTSVIAPLENGNPTILSGTVERGNIRFRNLGPDLVTDPCSQLQLNSNECTQATNNLLQPPPPASIPPLQPPSDIAPVLFPQEIALALENNDLANALALLDQMGCQEVSSYFGRTCDADELSLEQIQALLNEIAKQTGKKPAVIYTLSRPDQTDLLAVTPEGDPIYQPVKGVGQAQVLQAVEELMKNVRDPRLVNTGSYLPASQQLYQWLIAPLRPQLEAQGVETLVFVLDAGMRGIPMAVLHDGQGFLVERFSVGLVPSMSLMDARYRNIQQGRILAMGASEFVDQSPLPAVPIELAKISQDLGGGTEFLNEAFTISNLQTQRKGGGYQVVHLATHGEFQPGSPENSYIAFSDRRLNLIQLRNLQLYRPDTELLTLSACRTAAGDLGAELGFAGLAVQSGVKSVLASLWYVSDEGTLALMAQFYNQLNTAPIKAEALRQAQLAMLRGDIRVRGNQLQTPQGQIPLPPEVPGGDRPLSHPYYWSAFTMIGSPW
ncbi:CHAT domain-containing protein [Thermosynechococcaceae cyanobacterium Okahandja]